MLHILLAILKFIGIVLAAILGIIVLLICIVLFVPMRYKVEARCDGGWEAMEAEARVSWLCHLVSGYAVYRDGKFSWKMRILWKVRPQYENKKAEKQRTEKQSVPAAPEESKKPERSEESKKLERSEEPKENPEFQWEEEEPVIEKRKKNIFQKIKYTFQTICDKIKLLFEQKEKLEEFISDTVHKAAFSRAKQETVRLIRFLRPKKVKMNLHFGFEDPYNTGRVLAGLGMLYPFYGEYMNVDPDFEQKILEGDLLIKGHIHGIYAAIIVWNLFFDQNIRIVYKHIRALKG